MGAASGGGGGEGGGSDGNTLARRWWPSCSVSGASFSSLPLFNSGVGVGAAIVVASIAIASARLHHMPSSAEGVPHHSKGSHVLGPEGTNSAVSVGGASAIAAAVQSVVASVVALMGRKRPREELPSI